MNSASTKGVFSVILRSLHSLHRRSSIIRAIGRLIPNKPPKNLPIVDEIERVSDRTVRILGLNPGSHTLQGTNTWLITGIETSEHILVDTGERHTAELYVDMLFNKVFPMTGTTRLSRIILTHGHGDHQGGVLTILSELEKRNMFPLPTIHKRHMDIQQLDSSATMKDANGAPILGTGGGEFPTVGFTCEHISDMQVFQVDEQTTLQAIYTPGHTDDHVGFLLHEDGAFLSGDCVLGCGSSVFDDLHDYMESLRRIRAMILASSSMTLNTGRRIGLGEPAAATARAQVQAQEQVQEQSPTTRSRTRSQQQQQQQQYPFEITSIYPGHGPVIRHTALQKIDQYLAHRDAREEQLLYALAGSGADATGGGNGGGGQMQGKTKSNAGSQSSSMLQTTTGVNNSSNSSTYRGGVGGDDTNFSQSQTKWMPSWDLMISLYGNLPFFVKMSALHNISHHLQKLRKEGKVQHKWPDLWKLNQ